MCSSGRGRVHGERNTGFFEVWTGLYNQKYQYPPETIISHSFYVRNPEEFYRFYKDRMLFPEALPNAAHLALARLEAQGKLKAVITQNIDGLHQVAGSREVLELHGSVHRNYCTRCGKFYDLDYVIQRGRAPGAAAARLSRMWSCMRKGWTATFSEKSVYYIRKADMLIIGVPPGGVSGCGPDRLLPGKRLVLINKGATSTGCPGGSGDQREDGQVLGAVTGAGKKGCRDCERLSARIIWHRKQGTICIQQQTHDMTR